MNTRREKGMDLKTGIACALVAIALGTVGLVRMAHPDTPKVEQDAGALVLIVDDKPQAVVFISTTGDFAELGWEECAEKAECKIRFNALVAAHKVEGLQLFSETAHT